MTIVIDRTDRPPVLIALLLHRLRLILQVPDPNFLHRLTAFPPGLESALRNLNITTLMRRLIVLLITLLAGDPLQRLHRMLIHNIVSRRPLHALQLLRNRVLIDDLNLQVSHTIIQKLTINALRPLYFPLK